MPATLALFALCVSHLALLNVPPAARPAAPMAQGKGGVHDNRRFGFEFKPPGGWENIALKTDEAWLAAKYLSDKTYFYTDEETKWTWEHKPELMVIAFIHENMEQEEEVTEETEDGATTKTITFNNPYKDYEDYLDRTYAGGGFFVDKKETVKRGEIDVTKYTIKVEKLSQNGPKRIVTWIFHAPDIDFAMQVEVLEGEYKGLKRKLDGALESFHLIPRSEGGLPTSGKTDDFGWITIREMDEGTPDERRAKRVESQKQLHERAILQLPKDWEHLEVGGILVLSHTDAKYAKRVGKHAEQFLKWLDQTFPYLGQGEYVRAPILRVCRDQEEWASFGRGLRAGANWWFVGGDEITTHKDDSGFIGWAMNWVNNRLFDHWLQDRDRDLWSAMPEWLKSGLYAYVEGARSDAAGKLQFRIDDWDRDQTRVAVSQGRASSPRQLIQMTREELWNASGDTFWSHRQQSAMLVRFLMSEEGRKIRPARDLIEQYMKALDAAVEEQRKKDDTGLEGAKVPQTEEEEQAQAKERAERWRKREQELMKDVYYRVFGGWSGSDWESLQRGYTGFIS